MRDLGEADLFQPEAIGEPGKRTFRLRVRSGSDTASLWLEKEQLAGLAMAVRQLLEQAADEDTSPDIPRAPANEPFPDQPEIEFKIGRLGIGYDQEGGFAAIFAYALDDVDEENPTLTCQIDRRQCRTFTEEAEQVVSAGRPVCVLCGSPIDPDGHKCLRRNGHSERLVSLQ